MYFYLCWYESIVIRNMTQKLWKGLRDIAWQGFRDYVNSAVFY